MKIISKVLSSIILSFLVLTIIARLFGIHTYVVLSDSMAPHMRVNDLVYVKVLNDNEKQDLKEGDVVVFDHTSVEPTIHRIDNIDSSNLITTKGDNNDNDDGNKLSRSHIYAKEVFHIPLIGIFINSPLPIIIVIGFVVAYYLIKNIIKELKKGKEE